MIPKLFDANATDFTTNGLGLLGEIISCKVTEERNGEYELEAVYPISGKLFSSVEYNAIIYARAHEKSGSSDNADQPFRIYKISKPINGKVTIYARHISYQLSFVPVGYVKSTAYSSDSALTAMKDAVIGDCPFNFSSNLAVSGKTWGIEKPISVRSALGGDDGYLETFGGEILWDGYDVKILSSRGTADGVTIRYGKNLVDLTQEKNIEKTYTAILGYYRQSSSSSSSSSSDEQHIEGTIQYHDSAVDYPFKRVYIYDASSAFNDTVVNAYKKDGIFYKDSSYKTQVEAKDNNYYIDQSTVVSAYFNGVNMFTDSELKHQLSNPDVNKYYTDGNGIQRGYINGNYFYKSASDAEKGDTSKAEAARTHVLYVDQTNDDEVVYYYNETSKEFKYSTNGQNDYASTKMYYKWNGSAWEWYETFYPNGSTGTGKETEEIKNNVYRYSGGSYTLVGHRSDIPTVDDINRLAKAYMDNEENNFGTIDVSLTVSYQPLWETEEYKDIAPIEAVHLCDTVQVIFEKLGVKSTAKVTKTVYNTLMDRYDSIEVNSDWNKNKKNNLAATIANQSNTIKNEMDIQSSELAAAILNQTSLITGGRGGYIKLMYNDAGQPDELLIMDSPDYTTAQYIIRFNKNGIGFSQNGYDGPFNSAWTIDGQFSANWITTGLLTAITMQTAATGDRLMIKGRNNAIFGYVDDTLVNIIDMMGGSGKTATLILDSPNGIDIRTPQISVASESYGAGSGTVTKTLTEPFSIISNVSKNMDYGSELQKTTEIYIKGDGKDGASVYCTLPVYLNVEKQNVKLINGFITGTETGESSVI